VGKKGIERHHLFPKGYLRASLGITDLDPATYWPQQLAAKEITGNRLTTAMYWHALPDRWQHLPFEEFLIDRRKRMAFVVRDAMTRLVNPNYRSGYAHSVADAAPAAVSELRNLVDADLLPPGTTLVVRDSPDQFAHILPDGRLYADGETYDGLVELSDTLGFTGNPWTLWAAELPDGRVSLNVLRETLDDDRPPSG
jgi:hypothetical protein